MREVVTLPLQDLGDGFLFRRSEKLFTSQKKYNIPQSPMFQVDTFGPTTRLRMARSYFGKAFYWCYAYVLDDLLIDTGCPAAARPFQGFLDRHEVRRSLITHYHEDHAGNVVSLNLSGIPVYAPEASLDRIRKGVVTAAGGRQTFYGKIFWGESQGGEAAPLLDRMETDRHVLEVIKAPGHSDDMHLFYVRREGWLFSGDLFIGARKNYWRREEHPIEVMETIRRILALDFDHLFCAHAPSLKGGKKLLREKLAYLEEMHEKVTRLHDAGRSVPQIVKEIFGGEGFWTLITRRDFSRSNFVSGLLSDPQRLAAE